MRDFIKIITENTEADRLEAERILAFTKLADDQRGAPELAMLDVQYAMGGGVLNPVVEHVGDLTHRMAEKPAFMPYSGYEFVKPKVERAIAILSHGYGFDREFRENIASNARYRGVNAKELAEQIDRRLEVYAEEHAKLVVYNDAQKLAREAAVYVGRKQWSLALDRLDQLKAMMPDPETWHSHASQYDGSPK